jgi:hypothetical protein
VADFSNWHPGAGDPLRPPGFAPQRPIPNSPSYQQRHPTRYQWRDDIEDYIRELYRRFGGPDNIHINTYVCHPEHDDPNIRCRDTVSYDIWGKEGRNDPIGFDRGQKIFRFLFDDPGEPFIAWIIWNRRIWIRGIPPGPLGGGPLGGFRHFGTDPFSFHEDHIHLTATGPFRRLA